ncbi:TspO/MBR family protein [Patescibacteria group bacterium]
MKTVRLIFSIVICELVGIGGALFTSPALSSAWYKSLEVPAFNPPSWVFSPVWITLYALMGVSLYLVWRYKILFFVHLFLNGLWSVLFFGLQSPFYAFLDIVVLWVLILILAIKFYKVKKIAGILLLPYLAWVSFASVLNYFIWVLN